MVAVCLGRVRAVAKRPAGACHWLECAKGTQPRRQRSCARAQGDATSNRCPRTLAGLLPSAWGWRSSAGRAAAQRAVLRARAQQPRLNPPLLPSVPSTGLQATGFYTSLIKGHTI